MTLLGDFLDRMREDIRRKKEQITTLGKPHRFPCPYCTKDVEVEYGSDGTSYKLKHKVPGCVAFEKPTARTRSDLISAFVFHCRPKLRYGALEGLEGEKP